MIPKPNMTQTQKEQMFKINDQESKREKFEIHPAFTEDEYIFISTLFKIFKENHGTEGKKMAIAELRRYKKSMI